MAARQALVLFETYAGADDPDVANVVNLLVTLRDEACLLLKTSRKSGPRRCLVPGVGGEDGPLDGEQGGGVETTDPQSGCPDCGVRLDRSRGGGAGGVVTTLARRMPRAQG